MKIIPPTAFSTIPWKNGQGQTVELAINPGGGLLDFDWRLSMAAVVEDGVFSDFSGYQRHLVLIEGEGLTLKHENGADLVTALVSSDELTELLSVATFDGGCKTTGLLKAGAITDFNVITKASKYQVTVQTFVQANTVTLTPCHLCFVYALKQEAVLLDGEHKQPLPSGHLLMLDETDTNNIKVSGQQLIVVSLSLL